MTTGTEFAFAAEKLLAIQCKMSDDHLLFQANLAQG